MVLLGPCTAGLLVSLSMRPSASLNEHCAQSNSMTAALKKYRTFLRKKGVCIHTKTSHLWRYNFTSISTPPFLETPNLFGHVNSYLFMGMSVGSSQCDWPLLHRSVGARRLWSALNWTGVRVAVHTVLSNERQAIDRSCRYITQCRLWIAPLMAVGKFF